MRQIIYVKQQSLKNKIYKLYIRYYSFTDGLITYLVVKMKNENVVALVWQLHVSMWNLLVFHLLLK